MEIRIVVTEQHIRGESGANAFSEEASQRLAAARAAEDLTLVLDMSELRDSSAISSSMLGSIVRLRKLAANIIKQDAELTVRVEGTPRSVCEYFERTNLLRMFDVLGRTDEDAEDDDSDSTIVLKE